jgi:SOS response regulatory protein OraA/RecX
MRSRVPRVLSDTSPEAATTAGLVLLGLRELSTTQLRTRLARKGFPEISITEAISRLTANGALNDERTARARARHDLNIRRHGRTRVLRQVQALGVDSDTAKDAVARAFEDVDEDRQITDAVTRRMRGEPVPRDPKSLRRLQLWLIRQGFPPDRVFRLLRRGIPTGDE